MDVVLELPVELRADLKAPLGEIYSDPDALLARAGEPLITVGDIVTYHLITAEYHPHVALIDGMTKREAVEREVRAAIDGFDHSVTVESPPATLTAELLAALAAALDREGSTVIVVEGEEDLAALPAVLAAPDGASVVYGQPDEGMVLSMVDAELKADVRALLEGMDGDHEAAFAALGVA
jgi:uncharacterized protein (UPF0218 family)